MATEAPNWGKITSIQEARGLFDYSEFFGLYPATKLADFLEKKIVVDSGSGYDRLALDLAAWGNSATVFSVNPLRKQEDYAFSREKRLREDTVAMEWDIKGLLKRVDETTLATLAHEIDLPPKSTDVIFDVYGPIYYLKRPEWQAYIDATWAKYLDLLKPGGVIMVMDEGLRANSYTPPLRDFKFNLLRQRGIGWENQGLGIKVIKPL